MRKAVGFLIFLFLVAGCGWALADSGSRISKGSLVELKYDLEADGAVVISPAKTEGMRLVVGRGSFPAEFEQQLVGLRAGDKKTITLRVDQAFGPHRKELVRRIAQGQLPPALKNVKEGTILQSKSSGRPLRVVKVDAESVVLDQNYPLAGKKLVYHVRIESIA
ncbi:MAG: FKBP-type peptidyl-prolyl cis-trans isomerase [Candidatus Omnitrophota bacterium]